jgi:hypothetical protein
MSKISIGRVSHYLREYNCKAETTLCSPRRPGEGRLLILLQTHTEFSGRRYFDAEAGRNAVSSWVCVLYIMENNSSDFRTRPKRKDREV